MTHFNLLRYDWRNLAADRVPAAVAILLAVAIAYGAWNGSQWTNFRHRAINAALSEERSRLKGIRADIVQLDAGTGSKEVSAFADPRLPQSLGRNMGLRYAVMPPATLSALSVGQSDLYPYYFKVSTNSRQTFVNSDEIENPVHLLAGRFDLSFVILYLFPLVILALTYNLLSAGKEEGILALALSQPVTLWRLVSAQIVLRAGFVILLTILLSFGGVLLGGTNLLTSAALARFLFWIAITAAYGAFWFALAVGVNALGRSSATNAITLAGLWLLFVILIPAVVNVAVKAAYPVPSRIEMIQATRVAGEDATRRSSQLLARYMEDHPELAAPGSASTADFGTLLIAVNEATEKSIQPVLDRFDSQLAAQQAFVNRFRYLSPAIVTQFAFNDLAGTGPDRYASFLTQVARYHRAWRDFFSPRILRKVRITAPDLDSLPTFGFQEEETMIVLSRVIAPLAGLVLPTAIVALWAFSRLKRYPVVG